MFYLVGSWFRAFVCPILLKSSKYSTVKNLQEYESSIHIKNGDKNSFWEVNLSLIKFFVFIIVDFKYYTKMGISTKIPNSFADTTKATARFHPQ